MAAELTSTTNSVADMGLKVKSLIYYSTPSLPVVLTLASRICLTEFGPDTVLNTEKFKDGMIASCLTKVRHSSLHDTDLNTKEFKDEMLSTYSLRVRHSSLHLC